MAHDDAGGHAGGFRAAGSHELLHDDSHGLHENLHDAEIIKNGEERANEYNDGQDLEGDDDAKTAIRQTELIAENEAGSGGGAIQQSVDKLAEVLKQDPERCFENYEGESELEGYAPEYDAALNSRPLGGEQKSR